MKNKEKKYTYKEIAKAIDSVWRSHASNDSWEIPVLYKGSLKSYLRKYLKSKSK